MSLYKELKSCPNIFTVESTFSGIDFGEHKGEHVTQNHLESIGRDCCRSLLVYDNIYVPTEIKEYLKDKTDLNENVDYKNALISELV